MCDAARDPELALHGREAPMSRGLSVRRVVTGHDPAGKAVVIDDGVIPARPVLGGDAEFAVVWVTNRSPADNDDATDLSGEPIGLVQPGGSVLRIVDIPAGVRSPLHRTCSLDYGIVLAGEIDLELDEGKRTPLGVGDVVVQRGTIHAWINRGTTTARMAFVLLDAAPATVGGKLLVPVAHDIRPT
jgi:quercetin dioxygenase-like cupin family protein